MHGEISVSTVAHTHPRALPPTLYPTYARPHHILPSCHTPPPCSFSPLPKEADGSPTSPEQAPRPCPFCGRLLASPGVAIWDRGTPMSLFFCLILDRLSLRHQIGHSGWTGGSFYWPGYRHGWCSWKRIVAAVVSFEMQSIPEALESLSCHWTALFANSEEVGKCTLPLSSCTPLNVRDGSSPFRHFDGFAVVHRTSSTREIGSSWRQI